MIKGVKCLRKDVLTFRKLNSKRFVKHSTTSFSATEVLDTTMNPQSSCTNAYIFSIACVQRNHLAFAWTPVELGNSLLSVAAHSALSHSNRKKVLPQGESVTASQKFLSPRSSGMTKNKSNPSSTIKCSNYIPTKYFLLQVKHPLSSILRKAGMRISFGYTPVFKLLLNPSSRILELAAQLSRK